MIVTKNIAVPTGNILIVDGERGPLECLSLADYGKDVNIKCDAMGLSREPSPVRHTDLLPLEDKWVITVSTQYGCSMGCKFCDVPKVGPGENASVNDIINQVDSCLSLHWYKLSLVHRLNLHYARMGEPTWNWNVIYATYLLRGQFSAFGSKVRNFHPVVSTMMPRRNRDLQKYLTEWMRYKNDNAGECDAGLQLSINTTNREQRRHCFSNHSGELFDIADIMDCVFSDVGEPKGRKVTLNFAVADYDVDAGLLADLFDPQYYLCKLTPMHKTGSAASNGFKTDGDYTTYGPYRELEESLKDAGYDVLVFIASKEEDESRITCGNAILSDKGA